MIFERCQNRLRDCVRSFLLIACVPGRVDHKHNGSGEGALGHHRLHGHLRALYTACVIGESQPPTCWLR